ncbi:aminotransferase class I/II-fold pyridoxal phosphate-dependent enzyme [Spirosoma luteum]|uniref:aminotransferase class I/II-fold pyridoxal phosphate-dependent enzyme n=1 Tax=Spirosoma luteum TaxID=431553 RepID=UPI000372F26C|nr:aminotransferase class I/II-fold pyridoxal phosphate-dependent enzyme [Spirosoma luteum]
MSEPGQQSIFTINHLPGRTIEHNGKSYLFFSGTAYLGLPQNPVFQQLMIDATRQYGTVFGSSRNGNVRLGIYEEAEAKLATFVTDKLTDKFAALTLSSGMMAGQVVINWLRGQGMSIVYGSHTHPALWHEPVVSLPTLAFRDWGAQVTDQLANLPAGPVAILVNSLDAVRSVYFDFDWVESLPDDRAITLVVDDSHGLGVLTNGRGIWPQIPKKPNVRLVVTASLAKAMGLPGGAVFSDGETIDEIRKTAFFGACSPMPPACLSAFMKADSVYDEAGERLRTTIRLAEELLLPTGLFQHANGYPVFFTEQDDLYPYLLQQGICIYSFAYPTAADRANTRIVISAFHEPNDIEQLARQVYAYLEAA